MRPVRIESRDGLVLHCYLTLPLDVEPRGLPTVLLVHGGPWARDAWGYDPEAQLLANRGYAVLQVNYRGSTGFGKAFTHAAEHEFAGRMHDDLIDGVELGSWARASPTATGSRSTAARTAATRRWWARRSRPTCSPRRSASWGPRAW